MEPTAALCRTIVGTIMCFALVSPISTLHAQRIDRGSIKIIENTEPEPGETCILGVTGSGFLNVAYVEVKVDDIVAEIEDTIIVSDTELHIKIRFPRVRSAIRSHSYSVKVSAEGRAEALVPRPVTEVEPSPLPAVDTVAVTPDPPPIPEMTFLLDGMPFPDDGSLTVHLDSSHSKTLSIHNTGQAPLRLSNLQRPASFEVVGFPQRILADSNATIEIRWLPQSGSTPRGILSFNTNIPNRPVFSIQLTGTPTQTNPPIVDGYRTLLLIIAAVTVFAAGFIGVRRVGAKKSLHIKADKDFGRQEIVSGKILPRFEVALTPQLDFGQSTIHVKGNLLGKGAHIKTTPLSVETPPDAA